MAYPANVKFVKFMTHFLNNYFMQKNETFVDYLYMFCGYTPLV